MNAFQQSVLAFVLREVKFLGDLVDVVSYRFLEGSARKLHNKIVNQRPRDVLDKVVVGVAAELEVNRRASESGTKTLISFSLGTET